MERLDRKNTMCVEVDRETAYNLRQRFKATTNAQAVHKALNMVINHDTEYLESSNIDRVDALQLPETLKLELCRKYKTRSWQAAVHTMIEDTLNPI